MILNSNDSPMVPKFNVVLVEDDHSLRDEITSYLVANDFTVHAVPNAQSLSDAVAPVPIDLYVIDLNLPGEGGLSLSKRIREKYPAAGIVIITAKLGLSDKLASYSHGGADFYLNKPISPDELVLVLRNLGRRIRSSNIKTEWTLSLQDRTLIGPGDNQVLHLTNREKILILSLIQAKDNSLESGYLCDLFTSSDSDDFMSKHALEELIARLKRKFKGLELNHDRPIIKSVWGYGYQLCLNIQIIH